jgi:hypothetical protein
MAREKPIQLSRERLAVARAVWRPTARIDACAAQLFHHCMHRQAFLYILTAKPFPRGSSAYAPSSSVAAASGMSAVITKSPAATSSTMRASAASKLAGTYSALI